MFEDQQYEALWRKIMKQYDRQQVLRDTVEETCEALAQLGYTPLGDERVEGELEAVLAVMFCGQCKGIVDVQYQFTYCDDKHVPYADIYVDEAGHDFVNGLDK